MSAALLPPVPRPPHDPHSLRLDVRAGWRSDEDSGLTAGVGVAPDDGALTLLPLPGSGRLLDEPSGSFGGLTWPDHVAPLPAGGLVLLDRARGRLRRLDSCACRFVDWPCLGPDARDPRALAGPGGIAVGCGQLYLCDTGHARVVVINLRSGASRGAWPAPAGFANWQPTDVAVLGGARVAVSDPASGGIHVFSTHGVHRRFFGGLGAVRSLAVDASGCLLVRLDGESFVLRIDPDQGRIVSRPVRPEELAGEFPCLPVTVFADGAIDVSALCDDPQASLVVDAAGELVAVPEPEPAAYPFTGTWVSAPLDSGIARCTWDRVVLEGTLPPGSRVDVHTLTAETEEPPDLLAAKAAEEWVHAGTWRAGAEAAVSGEIDYMLRSQPGRLLYLKLVLAGGGAATPRLCSAEVDFPRISLRRYLPAVFGMEPAAAEFTDRWLAIFDRELRGLESKVDHQARYFDPLSCPASPPARDFLSWLAGWVGVTLERAWPEARRRQYLKHAPRLFPWRGTVQGLRGSLYLFLGLERWLGYSPARGACAPCGLRLPTGWRPPRFVLEHFRLRRWVLLGKGRLSDHARLWGERIVNRARLGASTDLRISEPPTGARLGVSQLKKTQDPYRDPFHVHAHRLSVFVPGSCLRQPALAKALKRLVELERPAHVAYDIVPVEPRFRVGVQSMLGLDAVVGVRPLPVALNEARLGRATVLPGAVDDRPAFRVGDARVGMKTSLT